VSVEIHSYSNFENRVLSILYKCVFTCICNPKYLYIFSSISGKKKGVKLTDIFKMQTLGNHQNGFRRDYSVSDWCILR
jgi:hypothetical protein